MDRNKMIDTFLKLNAQNHYCIINMETTGVSDEDEIIYFSITDATTLEVIFERFYDTDIEYDYTKSGYIPPMDKMTKAKNVKFEDEDNLRDVMKVIASFDTILSFTKKWDYVVLSRYFDKPLPPCKDVMKLMVMAVEMFYKQIEKSDVNIDGVFDLMSKDKRFNGIKESLEFFKSNPKTYSASKSLNNFVNAVVVMKKYLIDLVSMISKKPQSSVLLDVIGKEMDNEKVVREKIIGKDNENGSNGITYLDKILYKCYAMIIIRDIFNVEYATDIQMNREVNNKVNGNPSQFEKALSRLYSMSLANIHHNLENRKYPVSFLQRQDNETANSLDSMRFLLEETIGKVAQVGMQSENCNVPRKVLEFYNDIMKDLKNHLDKIDSIKENIEFVEDDGDYGLEHFEN